MTKKRKQNLRRRLFAKQDGRCWLCGEKMDDTIGPHHPMSVTLDHVIPLHDGGRPSSAANIKLAHRLCNMERARSAAKEKRARLESAGQWAAREAARDVKNATEAMQAGEWVALDELKSELVQERSER